MQALQGEQPEDSDQVSVNYYNNDKWQQEQKLKCINAMS